MFSVNVEVLLSTNYGGTRVRLALVSFSDWFGWHGISLMCLEWLMTKLPLLNTICLNL